MVTCVRFVALGRTQDRYLIPWGDAAVLALVQSALIG